MARSTTKGKKDNRGKKGREGRNLDKLDGHGKLGALGKAGVRWSAAHELWPEGQVDNGLQHVNVQDARGPHVAHVQSVIATLAHRHEDE
jgi:hypothetical protein